MIMGNFWSITISDIIAIVALIAAVWAAWAATISNKNAKQSLEEARTQFQENMRIQNHAINVSLFDLRMEILISVEAGKFAFNRTRARMLFNDSIADTIDDYDIAKREERRYTSLKEEYAGVIASLRADDTYDKASDLLEKIDCYSIMDPEAPDYSQIQDDLRQYSLTGSWANGAVPFETETINYVDVEEAEHSCYLEAEELRKKITKMMKEFIQTSIL